MGGGAHVCMCVCGEGGYKQIFYAMNNNIISSNLPTKGIYAYFTLMYDGGGGGVYQGCLS